jgi:hypothetical protein
MKALRYFSWHRPLACVASGLPACGLSRTGETPVGRTGSMPVLLTVIGLANK